jgi:hypothetical protein
MTEKFVRLDPAISPTGHLLMTKTREARILNREELPMGNLFTLEGQFEVGHVIMATVGSHPEVDTHKTIEVQDGTYFMGPQKEEDPVTGLFRNAYD